MTSALVNPKKGESEPTQASITKDLLALNLVWHND